jgi:hypothetical protein
MDAWLIFQCYQRKPGKDLSGSTTANPIIKTPASPVAILASLQTFYRWKRGDANNRINKYLRLTWFPFNQYNRFEEVNMSGIVSCGAYVPLWRLNLAAITSGLKGEKSVCNFDEDGITMAAAAAIDCLRGVDRRGVDGFFLPLLPHLIKRSKLRQL